MPSQLAAKALQQSLPTLHLAFLYTLAVLYCTIHIYLPAQTFLLRLPPHDHMHLFMPLVALGMLSQRGTL